MNYFKKSLLMPHIIGFEYRNFNEFLFNLGLNRSELTEITGLSTRTIQRYCNQNKAPQWLFMVAYCASGYLLADKWAGWHLSKDNGLTHHASPACKHQSIQPTQINSWFILHQQNTTLTLKIKDLALEHKLVLAKMAKVDHRRLVPRNVIPLKTTYKNIYNQMKGVSNNA
ncbi:MAG: hypothetical protein QM500_21410 [Methylococcales bacterium]